MESVFICPCSEFADSTTIQEIENEQVRVVMEFDGYDVLFRNMLVTRCSANCIVFRNGCNPSKSFPDSTSNQNSAWFRIDTIAINHIDFNP